MTSATWSLQDAKNKFSAVVDAANSGVPQMVTKRGRPAVVVVSAEEYERLQHLKKVGSPDFKQLLLAMPQDGVNFDSPPVHLRDVEF